MSRGLASWGALSSLWLLASPASAQLSIALEDCRSVGSAEVAAALELELGAEPSSNLSVHVACEDDAVTIEVLDRVTEQRVSRRVAGVDTAHPGAAQIVALLASELVLASWVERLLAPRAPEAVAADVEPSTPSAAREDADAEPSVVRDAEQDAEPDAGDVEGDVEEDLEEDAERDSAPDGDAAPAATPATGPDAAPEHSEQDAEAALEAPITPRASLRLDLGGGVRLRDVAAPFVPVFIALRGLVPIDSGWSIGVRASVEFSEIARSAGTISHAAVGAGLVLGWQAFRAGEFVLDLFIEARGAWARLDARPARTSIEGRAVDALLLELEGTLAPSFVWGSVDVALEASLGVTVVGPVGTVTAEPDVTLPGLFLGVGLAVGLR